MKYVILVGDGMGDLPLPELGGKTPLEIANTPAMDHLCRHGELLQLQTIPDGFSPGSDVANLSLLGYLPREFYTGRAPLEAASMGITLQAGEVACRCNLVTLDHSPDGKVTMIDYSAGHISSIESRVLIQELNDLLQSEKLQFYPGISYRHLMVHQGDMNGLKTVPPHDYIDQDVTKFWQWYQEIPHIQELLSAASTMLNSHEINNNRLNNGLLPANSIWLWGQGKSPVMPTLEAQYGISGALISAVDLLKGIGVYGGLEIINVPGATGYIDTNYQGKVDAALSALTQGDFVFVHVEAPDETGHQGLVQEKIRAIEDFDQKIVKPILDGLNSAEPHKDFRLVITMDHFTPVSTKTHSTDPVPLVIFDSRTSGSGCELDYSEKNGRTVQTILKDGRKFFKRFLEQE